MSDIFKGTRLAWIAGADNEEQDAAVANGDHRNAPLTGSARPASGKTHALKAIWILGGLLALLLPVSIRNGKLNNYQNKSWAGAANAVQQGGGYNGQYNGVQGDQYGGAQGQQQQGPYFRDVNDCKWWKWGCTPYYVDERGEYVSEYEMQQRMYEEKQRQQEEQYSNQYNYNNPESYNYNSNYGEGGQQQYGYTNYGNRQNGQGAGAQGAGGDPNDPNYYYFKQMQQRQNASNASLKVFYGIQIIAFIGILAYGHTSLAYSLHPLTMMKVLLSWFFLCCLVMILLKTMSIKNQINNPYNLRGYYGQFSVLLFMTNEAFAIFSLVGVALFYHSTSNEEPHQNITKEIETDYVNV